MGTVDAIAILPLYWTKRVLGFPNPGYKNPEFLATEIICSPVSHYIYCFLYCDWFCVLDIV